MSFANTPRRATPRVHLRIALRLVTSFLLVVIAACALAGESDAPLSREEVITQFKDGVAQLDKVYWSPALGIWLDAPGDDLRAHYEGRRNPPWWQSANAVEVLIDFMNATGDASYDTRIATLYDLQKNRPAQHARVVAELKARQQWSEADEAKLAARGPQAAAPKPDPEAYYADFQNEYLDDSGWWAVTWLKYYERTREPKYLATAKHIHAHMAKDWRPDKGGGVLWCEDADKQRVNSITNSLFLILSARLYSQTKEPSYLAWAEKTLAWIRENALYDGTGVVDGPGHHGDYWTYNQGAYLGGLTALSQATGRPEYVEEAAKAADGMLTKAGLTRPDGTIVEKLRTNGDAALFKAVFVRYLGQLRDVLNSSKLHPETVERINRDLRASAASLLQNSRGAEGLFTVEWHAGAKDRTANFNTQVSALSLLASLLSGSRP